MADAPPKIDLKKALPALRGQSGLRKIQPGDLTALPRLGLAHLHWRIRGTGKLLRVPLVPSVDLKRQATAFERLAKSGHVPALHAVLPPREGLPLGALLVDEIDGHAPELPRDFSALARTLAAIHELPVPARRGPLDTPDDPFAATLETIERNFATGDRDLAPKTRKLLMSEIRWARGFAAKNAKLLRRAPRALVLTDTHPRNFIIDDKGTAFAVDLEKTLYGAPAIDIAHAMLPAAIAWGKADERVGEADRRRFLMTYFLLRGPKVEQAMRPLLKPMLRLTWLRTTVAFAAIAATGAEKALGSAARATAQEAIAAALDPRRIARSREAWLAL